MRKICVKCGKKKALKEFVKNQKISGGLSPWCKSCSGVVPKKQGVEK
jgi:hypothetical protein